VATAAALQGNRAAARRWADADIGATLRRSTSRYTPAAEGGPLTAADAERAETIEPTHEASDATPVEKQGFLKRFRHGLRWVFLRHFAYLGLVGALVSFLLSLTPSLLPRAALLAGVVGGLAAAVGYGFGSAASALLRRWVDEPSAETKRWAWWGLMGAALVLIPIMFTLATGWQNTVRQLMDMEPFAGWAWLTVLITAAVVAYLMLVIARSIRGAGRGLIWLIDRLLPRAVAVTIGFVVMFLLVIGIIQGFVVDGLITAVEAYYSVWDQGTTEGTFQSQSEFRSGSPASLVPWDTLGNQGRDFAGEGEAADFADIQAFNDGNAIEPIRVYVGLRSADTLDERVELALAEDDEPRPFGLRELGDTFGDGVDHG
jgi:uncharacterized membrane protein